VWGQTACVKLLLERGADLELECKSPHCPTGIESPLEVAQRLGKTEIHDMILAG
jgi:hypothetical protein